MTPADNVDLNFLAQQMRRLLDEMAELRGDLHGGIAGVKEDMGVLTAIVLRLEGKLTRIEERIDRFGRRITALEDRP